MRRRQSVRDGVREPRSLKGSARYIVTFERDREIADVITRQIVQPSIIRIGRVDEMPRFIAARTFCLDAVWTILALEIQNRTDIRKLRRVWQNPTHIASRQAIEPLVRAHDTPGFESERGT